MIASGVEQQQRAVLSAYARPIAHLRRQIDDHRLDFMLGAGMSLPYRIPAWPGLVARLADHPEVQAPGSLTSDALPLPLFTEILFQRFQEGQLHGIPEDFRDAVRDRDRLIASRWRRTVQSALYQDAPSTDELLSIDSAYPHFLDAISSSQLVVTYNFDDVLERLLLLHRDASERARTQTFQSIVDPRSPFRRGQTTILHPNGYLPSNPLEAAENTLVFSESSFEDQLIDVMGGQYSTLLHYLSKYTFLLMGLSLGDETLRHLLRQAARLSPGNYHYYVRFVNEDEELPEDRRRAESRTNFEVYNLITLHLRPQELSALGDLLSMRESDLRAMAEEEGVPLQYTYYLAGVPGVGKSTTFRFFNSLVTHDEWTEPRLPLMSLPFTKLSTEETQQVDSWIMDQLYKKNLRMLEEERRAGVHLVDRCPPDAITFTPHEKWPQKAKEVLAAVSPKRSRRKIHDGHVILLEAEPREVAVRAAMREKTTSPEYTAALARDLRELYGGSGTTVLTVNGMTPTEVAKEVARTIYFQPYSTANLDDRVRAISLGSSKPASGSPESGDEHA